MLTQFTAVPAARTSDLVTTESGDEVLVYDQATHHIHHLNRTSAVIWRLCDGQRSIRDLGRVAATQLEAQVDEDVVRLAVSKLADAGLLDGSRSFAPLGHAQTRRTLLRRAAIAGAIAVPAVVSMTAPTSADSSHCNSGCQTDADCGGGTTCASCLKANNPNPCGMSSNCTCR